MAAHQIKTRERKSPPMTIKNGTNSIPPRVTTPEPPSLLRYGVKKLGHFITIHFSLAVIAMVAIVPVGLLAADMGGCPVPPQSGVLQDYVYGYAPVALDATRAILTAVPDATTMPGFAPVNQFARQEKLADPSETLIVRPNTDTLYTNAWLDLKAEPIILHVPDTGGRYYLIPMLDAYSNEFASIGSRTTGNGAGDFAIVGPQWRGELPPGLSGVVHAPTNSTWLIGRTLVKGQDDLAAAVALTKQYQLLPLSAYAQFLQSGEYTPSTNVPVIPPNSDFIGSPITSSQGFSEPRFFDVLAAFATENPAPVRQEPEALRMVLDGFLHQSQLTSDVATQAQDAFEAELLCTSTLQNGWMANSNVGNYGNNYLLRGAVALHGLGANIPADALYENTFTDVNGNQLDGNKSYVIHFPSGQTPPINGFWSVTVYGPNELLVANPIQRYSAGSESSLVPNPDGSIDILLQTTLPAQQSNWLPTPAGPFSLTLRLYWPAQSVLNGTWTVPGVTPKPGE
jgi:hypothetical protein